MARSGSSTLDPASVGLVRISSRVPANPPCNWTRNRNPLPLGALDLHGRGRLAIGPDRQCQREGLLQAQAPMGVFDARLEGGDPGGTDH